eukprot:4236144-Prymnesium_polylepis.2
MPEGPKPLHPRSGCGLCAQWAAVRILVGRRLVGDAVPRVSPRVSPRVTLDPRSCARAARRTHTCQLRPRRSPPTRAESRIRRLSSVGGSLSLFSVPNSFSFSKS